MVGIIGHVVLDCFLRVRDSFQNNTPELLECCFPRFFECVKTSIDVHIRCWHYRSLTLIHAYIEWSADASSCLLPVSPLFIYDRVSPIFWMGCPKSSYEPG